MEQLNEVNLFIQKNQKFYEEKFRKMYETGKSISWNWAAFFILSLVASSTPYIGVILNFAVLVGIGIYAC